MNQETLKTLATVRVLQQRVRDAKQALHESRPRLVEVTDALIELAMPWREPEPTFEVGDLVRLRHVAAHNAWAFLYTEQEPLAETETVVFKVTEAFAPAYQVQSQAGGVLVLVAPGLHLEAVDGVGVSQGAVPTLDAKTTP